MKKSSTKPVTPSKALRKVVSRLKKRAPLTKEQVARGYARVRALRGEELH